MEFEVKSNLITNALNEILDKSKDNEMYGILENMQYNQVEYLLQVINYSRSKEILTKIFPKTADIAFGCRKPNSVVGSWQGAFVYVQTGRDKVYGIFENGQDFIGHPKNVYEAVKLYNAYMKTNKAVPMTVDDIVKTSGIQIDGETELNLPKPRRFWKTIIFIGLAAIPLLHFVRF